MKRRPIFPHSEHDHDACIRAALHDAELYCRRHGLRLTSIRRRVLELVWQSHRPHGAYDLLEKLAAEGHKPSPPTVYRALEFLCEHGLVHRVTSRNAYIGCTHPGASHNAQLFICDACGVALEQADAGVEQSIRRNARDLHFQIRQQTVEIAGLCPVCAGGRDAD